MITYTSIIYSTEMSVSVLMYYWLNTKGMFYHTVRMTIQTSNHAAKLSVPITFRFTRKTCFALPVLRINDLLWWESSASLSNTKHVDLSIVCRLIIERYAVYISAGLHQLSWLAFSWLSSILPGETRSVALKQVTATSVHILFYPLL